MSLTGRLKGLSGTLAKVPDGPWHLQALFAYLLIALGHLSEHLAQVAQVFLFGWARDEAGGILGLLFSGVAENELLHVAYNSFQLTGLIVLAYGFRRYGAAHTFLLLALMAQSWHWLEHAFLMYQLTTGHFFYGALKQMSLLERFVPRTELHFLYNLAVFVPTAIALSLLILQRSATRVTQTSHAPNANSKKALKLSSE